MEILTLQPIRIGYDEGDFNCSPTGYLVPRHQQPDGGKPCPQGGIRIVQEKYIDLEPRNTVFGSWTCKCGTVFEVCIQD